MRLDIWLMSAALLLFAGNAFAQEDEKADSKQESTTEVETETQSAAQQELESIQEEAEKIQQEAMEQMMALRSEMADDASPDEMMAASMKIQKEAEEKLEKIAGRLEPIANSTDDLDTSLDAIKWIFSNTNNAKLHKQFGEMLIKHHVNNPEVPQIVAGIPMPTETVRELFQAIIDNSENRDIRGQASFNLVKFIANSSQMADGILGNKQIEENFPEAYSFLSSVADMEEEELMAQMKALNEEFGDVEVEDSTIGELVGREIKAFEIRSRVKVGKEAPDIEGPDIDGTDFKLSDYRGKVVMLDFWGDW